MNDADLLALCVWDEARGEPADGKAAVARVVLNRMKARYESDGSIAGTVLAPNQFSGFWFDMVGRVYERVCHTLAEAQAHADTLLEQAEASPVLWGVCQTISSQVQSGTYRGAQYGQLTDQAVLYLNPAISRASWATPDKLVCVIGAHSFYRA